ncbi:head-tail connector protein [Desulfotomaculum copahuensis]|uniref:Phage gp6-like head-tail connector protein n=1 Tax=Desulfotomaculum copahuensis TaxID=1838280 RepID=A0A1B7LDH1_9FIRM|nr:head-tail connector protein [Desulfotomaculum copahuensis]OAT81101.1 hypothetical protein A6M21_11860 [Desulfotomaculum copahuensis]
MALSVHALTTLAAVKDFLKIEIDDNQYDTLLERMINAASEAIEGYCNRHFERGVYDELYRGNGRQLLGLNQYPVQAVTLVEANGARITDYQVYKEEGMLYRLALWPAGAYFTGLVGDPVGSTRNIRVLYEAGYVLPKDEDLQASPPIIRTLPYDLEDACIELVALKFNQRQEEAAGKVTRAQADYQTTYQQDIPPRLRQVLDRHRRLVVV